MNKDEVLKKSREEKSDEGREFVLSKGRKSGVIGMVGVFIILALFNLFNDLQETNFALIAIFFGYLGGESFGMYNVSRKKVDFIKFIIGGIISLLFTVLYIYGVMN